MRSPHAWARTLWIFSSSPSGGVWLVCNRHSAPFTVATPIVWWPSKPVSTAGPNIALSVTGPNCRSNERSPKFVKRTSLAKTSATNSAAVATSAPLPTTRRNAASCAAMFSLVLFAATPILASRAISQKSVACLSNTFVVAPRKTPQLSPASPGGSLEATRRSFNRDFLLALAADFKKHGAAAIEKVREQQPAAYMKICALLVPREMKLEHAGGVKAMTEDQIVDAIAAIEVFLARRSGETAKVIEGEAEVVPSLPPARPTKAS